LTLIEQLIDIRVSKFFVERRKDVRYRLAVPAIFSWEHPSGIANRREGITRDISSSGAFVMSTVCPPAESRVEVEIIVSALPGEPRAWLKASMKVLRVEQGAEGDCGFSLAGEAFIVRRESRT